MLLALLFSNKKNVVLYSIKTEMGVLHTTGKM